MLVFMTHELLRPLGSPECRIVFLYVNEMTGG